MLVAARDGAWAKSGYTARDYVQDGLIAMWDGIENAGWGVHDPSVVSWNDLLSERKANVAQGGISFGYDYMHLDGNAHLIVSSWNDIKTAINTGRSLSVESVFAFYQHGDWNGIYAIGYSETLLFDLWYADSTIAQTPSYNLSGHFASFGIPNDGRRLLVPYGERVSISQTWDGSAVKFYKNGVLFCEGRSNPFTLGSSYQIGLGNDQRGIIDFCSHRVSSKCLTQLEISENYAIDKVRFNLP